MSKSNNLTQQLVSVLQEMVNDYGFNRCDDKRLETIGMAKKLLDNTRQSMPDSSVIEPTLTATIADLKAELDQVKNRNNQLETYLEESSQTMSSMREQIEQMRPMFDDEDDAIQSVCDSHDELLSTIAVLGGVA
ncbi:hypothetical protein [Methylosarcina fibrata]|uniref:hypothetical protein n=1 Tax=Methylosarcina fibrata TaxID=105972 RepID=UPI0012FCA5ED|nr:hypothetical protein [Methylosarcina fibrata]